MGVTELVAPPQPLPLEPGIIQPRAGLVGWIGSTDHKRIALMTGGVSLVCFLIFGMMALLMRTQLARPDQHVVSIQVYNELFTLHGSGMIVFFLTPLAVAFGVYLVPLQVGAPVIAASRTCIFSFWLYVSGFCIFMLNLATPNPANTGWYSYVPLSTSRYSPGYGMDLWVLGMIMGVSAMMIMSGCVLWTALRLRAPGVTLMRMPVFTWSEVVTCLMSVASFPALIAAMGMIAVGRADPGIFSHDTWDVAYQFTFWFYGHPVVYVMFFPFVGCVATVLAAFSRKKYFGYHFTVIALLAFAAGSMVVFGHHMFTTGQSTNPYFSLTSIMLAVPAGVEYFGFLATLIGGKITIRTPMLFALAFIPQFLIGGLTGIMIATPVLDYAFQGSYFIVAHFHYTLFAGSLFGAFAGLYYWFPKATGVLLDEKLGKLSFWIMVVGTNATFGPMFVQGFEGLPRRVAIYSSNLGVDPYTLASTIGAFVIAIGVGVTVFNVAKSLIVRIPAGADPWGVGQGLEWVTSSPPPMFNFDELHPIPKVKSYAPLLDLRHEVEDAMAEERGGIPRPGEAVPPPGGAET
jgi:cytochrome c oxidase subunit I